MGSVAIVFAVFCVAPMLLIAFGYWLGRGMPGSPVVIMRREAVEQQRSGGASRMAASRMSSLEHVE